jgi:hypothetical protein
MNTRSRSFLQQVNNTLEKIPNWLWVCCVVAAFVALLFNLFGPVLKDPGNYVMGMWGDSIKNHFTTLYYIQYDRGAWFTGMNYPFGEQITFPDTQPLLAYSLGFFNRNIYHLSAKQTLALLNGFMFLSMALGGGILFLILRKSLLPPVYAALTAGLIIFLSPQHFRLTGHYGLAYTFIIPALWYCIIKIFESRRRWLWQVVFVALAIAFGLLHAYFVLIAALFLLAYTFVFALQNLRHLKKYGWFIPGLFFTAILPVILFQGWLYLTDPVTDRPKEQYGFFVFVSNFDSIFFPWISPYKEMWQTLLHTTEPIEEGKAYVGVMGLVCLVLTAFRALFYLLRLKLKFIFKPVLPHTLRVAVWAAVILVLYAMAYPFKLGYGFEKLLDIFPQLKQFRSLGRFAWVFYYVFSVYMAFYFYQLYRYLSIHRAWKFGITFLLFVLTVWYLDAKVNLGREIIKTREIDKGTYFTDAENNYRSYLASVNMAPQDFQAIIPLPYFSIGAQKFSIDRSESVFETFRASLNTGLPVAATMMSRTSNRQTADILQLFSNDLIPKKVLTDLPSKKPFLLLVQQGVPLEPYEQHLIAKATQVFENQEVKLYKLPLENLKSTRQQALRNFQAIKGNLNVQNGIYTEGKSANVVFRDFTKGKKEAGFLNTGAFTQKEFGNFTIFDSALAPEADTTLYEASIWVSTLTNSELPLLHYKQITPEGNIIEERTHHLNKTVDNFQYWVRGAITFRLKSPRNKLLLTLEGKEIIADNLLIRPVSQPVYVTSPTSKTILFNNFPIAF